MYKIRDWGKHFEHDRSKQWKNLQWVPVPNKQGKGYRKIMKEKDGLEIFACWIAMIELASKCEPRGDLSKYSIDDISLLTLIDENKLKRSIKYLSEVLDWIEVIKDDGENLDKNVNKIDKNVNKIDVHGMSNSFDSSILFNSIQSNLNNNHYVVKKNKKNTLEEIKEFEPPLYLRDVWPDFEEMRKKIRKPLTDKARELTLKELNKLSDDQKTQVKILEQSIQMGWQGVFPLKTNYQNKGSKIQGDFNAEGIRNLAKPTEYPEYIKPKIIDFS
jgi:hypothetical protein